tara:strand:- start:5920 stop:7584 length:1665 start_codon:yes stop_codon:yes gene_type:complete
MYLRRRIEDLLADLREGRLHDSESAQLKPEIEKVTFQPDGSVDLDSCSPTLRSIARAYALTKSQTPNQPARTAEVATPDARETAQLNRELFDKLGQFFQRVTGRAPNKFLRGSEDFSASIRRLGESMKGDQQSSQVVNDAFVELYKYLRESNDARLRGALALVGSKLVLGGTQFFSNSSLHAVRSMLLYCDTVLIADPVLPFLEGQPTNSRFVLPRMLEQIFFLSQLRPLIDADLPYPAIVVFPSYEKLMQAKDLHTQDGLELQFLGLFSHFADATFEDSEELYEFAASNQGKLITAIESNQLLIPPGGTGSEPFGEAVALIRAAHGVFGTTEFKQQVQGMSDMSVALSHIGDRLIPQFHLAENADSLGASPLIAVPQQWHYFRLLRQVERETLVRQGILQGETGRLIEALTTPPMEWLGNVPLEDLVTLRRDLVNEKFRKTLGGYLTELGEADDGNLDQVTARTVRALTNMMAEHGKDVRKITEDYQHKHSQTAVGAWISAGALFLPTFPVAAPMAALGIFSKYVVDKVGEKRTLKKKRKTLMGVLAAAKAKG